MKLNYKNTILVGLAFLTISAFWQLYDFHIPLILQNTFGIDKKTTGIVMAIDNILALFLLPLFGIMSDRAHSKLGRRTPFIIGGTVAAVVFMMGIPFATHTRQIVVFVCSLGLLLLSMSFYRSPAVALMPDVTPKPLRSKGNAVINLMGSIGGGLILVVNMFLAPDAKHPETANYWPLFISTAAIMLVGTAVLIFTVREPKLVKKMREDSAAMGIDPEEAKEPEKIEKTKQKLPKDMRKSMGLILSSIFLWFMGYNAITTWFSSYAINALAMTEKQASGILMVAIIAAAISFIPIGLIASKVGRRKSILFGVVLLTAVFGSAAFYTAYSPLMYVSFALAGVAWAAINVNSLPMVLEMSKGATVGRYTGYYYTFSMAAQAATPFLAGVLLDAVGFSTLLPYGAVFVGLAFFTMLFVRHGDFKPIAPASKLEAFDVAD